jgi:hypothetical protein
MEFQPFVVFILFAIFIFASTTHSAPFDGDAEEFQSRFHKQNISNRVCV